MKKLFLLLAFLIALTSPAWAQFPQVDTSCLQMDGEGRIRAISCPPSVPKRAARGKKRRPKSSPAAIRISPDSAPKRIRINEAGVVAVKPSAGVGEYFFEATTNGDVDPINVFRAPANLSMSFKRDIGVQLVISSKWIEEQRASLAKAKAEGFEVVEVVVVVDGKEFEMTFDEFMSRLTRPIKQ